MTETGNKLSRSQRAADVVTEFRGWNGKWNGTGKRFRGFTPNWINCSALMEKT